MTNEFDVGRLLRLLVLIAFVSAISILTSAEALEGRLFQISVFAVGSVAFLTAMFAFLIAGSAAYDYTEK